MVNVSSSLQSSAPKCGVRFGPGEYPTVTGMLSGSLVTTTRHSALPHDMHSTH